MRFSISNWNELDVSAQNRLLERPVSVNEDISSAVADIVSAVRTGGDIQLLAFAKKFDGLVTDAIVCDINIVRQRAESIEPELKQAIDDAFARIYSFHKAAKPRNFQVETANGVVCSTRYRGYEQIGLYIPGGSAPLISTVLMLGIPALIAGVKNISLCTPFQNVENLHPGIAYAALKCVVDSFFSIGGAHAIAAMAYGTETIQRAQKIFGPGNSWVTEAKQQVAFDPKGAAIDMPAGPSEVMVIADKNANSDFVAIDLLSQAEHGPDSQAIVLSDNFEFLEQVSTSLTRQLKSLSRQDILGESQKNIRLILVDDLELAIEIANDYAPEHLILQTDNADGLAESVINAGSVFIGAWAPESLGDYCSGTNHVLPTYGFARSYNGLAMTDFMQKITFQKVTQQGIRNIGPCAMTLASAEGLDAHKRAVEIRLQAISREEAK